MKQVLVLYLFCVIFALVPAAYGAAQNEQEGNATWYDTDSLDLHASHPKLKAGTKLRVTNLENNRVVYVTVNKNISSSPDRIVDISAEAARRLEMTASHFTPVRIEVVKEIPPEAEAPPPVSEQPAEVAGAPPLEQDRHGPPKKYEPSYTDIEPVAEEPPPPPPAVAAPPPPSQLPLDEDMAGASTPGSAAHPAPQPPVRFPPPQQAAEGPQPPVRVPPPQQGAENPQPEVSVERSIQGMTVKVIVNINGKEHVVEIPNGDIPPQEPAEQSRRQPSSLLDGASSAKIVPKMPDPKSNGVYRVQVGSFASTAFARNYFDRLTAAGFHPNFEQYGKLYRVVLSGIKAADMAQIAQRLGSAGFNEVWVREEK
ncbi:MAG: SPOR domain-containing protein [Treponema sp.]|jgi:hypothetical protein|nr:SPOR domain-containing protein [Treponema sp.]